MVWLAEDATLEELLADPVIAALMRSDGVSRAELLALLATIATRREETTDAETVVMREIAAEEEF